MAGTEPTTPAGNNEPDKFVFKANGKDVEIPNLSISDDLDLKTLLNTIMSQARKDGEQRGLKNASKTVEEQLKAIEQEKQELAQRLEQFESTLPEKERQQKAVESKASKVEKENAELRQLADRRTAQYFETMIDNHIKGSLAGYELMNSEQTAALIRAMCKPRVVEEADGAHVVLTVGDEDLAPKEAIQRLLASDEFSFHLKANQRPGAGTTGVKNGRKLQDGTLAFRRSEMRHESVRKEYNEARARGEDPKIIDDLAVSRA